MRLDPGNRSVTKRPEAVPQLTAKGPLVAGAVCVPPHFVVVLAREGPTYTSKGDIRFWQQLWRLKMRTWLTVYVAPMSIESHGLDWVFVWQKSVYALLMHLEAPY